MTSRPLYGLYLAGGASSRMGTPKRDLAHLDNHTFLQHATAQLAPLCDQVYISTATALPDLPYPQICDDTSNTADLGPLGGLLAAHLAHPDASWLLLACDLPAISTAHLELLTQQSGSIVAFANPIDNVPEATATLYHPGSLAHLHEHLTTGGSRCMRSYIEQQDLTVLPAPSYAALQNVNTPQDYREWQARAAQNYDTPEITLTVEYYAKLRQDAGTAQATVTTRSVTLAGLWEECRFQHNLSLKLPSVKPAVNNSFTPWDYQLQPDDLVAFMPPFAGG